ncbi:MAG TPA: hypothetical protein VEY51_15700 [Chondromyces sp.]|nr:hypothetical protein [Chondromyces sp.]
MENLFQEVSKLDIKVFDQKGSRPFKDLTFNHKKVVEISDQTLRTPLEKTDVFNELLRISQPCELWIIPVKEETAAVLDMVEEERTAALFSMLSAVKDTIQRDRTFIVVDTHCADTVINEVKNLGFTVSDVNQEELINVQIAYD